MTIEGIVDRHSAFGRGEWDGIRAGPRRNGVDVRGDCVGICVHQRAACSLPADRGTHLTSRDTINCVVICTAINTCGVRDEGVDRNRNQTRQARLRSRKFRLVVSACLVDRVFSDVPSFQQEDGAVQHS